MMRPPCRAPAVTLAIPLAIRSLSQDLSGCDRSDGGPDVSCVDALG
jgi:hypothetical protein